MLQPCFLGAGAEPTFASAFLDSAHATTLKTSRTNVRYHQRSFERHLKDFRKTQRAGENSLVDIGSPDHLLKMDPASRYAVLVPPTQPHAATVEACD